MIGLRNGLFDFQKDCVEYLLNTTLRVNSKLNIVVKAPTGAGKTIILLDFIDKYLQKNPKTAFIWLCPGKGNLEEQSMNKMKKYLPLRKANNLLDSILDGFTEGSTTFINWELITKRGNTAISDTERRNIFDRIAAAHRSNVTFMVIIDEEHSNDTKKAVDMINAFGAKNIIRVSATARENRLGEFYEISEIEVILSGLITKAIYINEDVDPNEHIDNHNYLIDLAIEKRKEIAEKYINLSKSIRPLIIIQFPNSSDSLIKDVENYLEIKGYTYDNQMVAKWMDNDKKNIAEIEKNDAMPIVLLIKQAIATGWDCPRSKILVKLREHMDETFTIQTIGRIRRMPEQVHYEEEVLDNCYLYTFDKTYTKGLKSSVCDAYDVKRLVLKEKCKKFTMVKQLRDPNYRETDERIVLQKITNYFIEKYKLIDDFGQNKLMLSEKYEILDGIKASIITGKFSTIDSILDGDKHTQIETIVEVNLQRHGIDLTSAIDDIKNAIDFPIVKTRVILERLFRANVNYKNKLLNLNTKDFYAFIINNRKQLKEDFQMVAALTYKQMRMNFSPPTTTFSIPLEELYFYDSLDNHATILESNAYNEYPTSTLVQGIRSKTERLFERYCEQRDIIDWVYKNGDKGQQYFSTVYFTGLEKQKLFYPDYIIKLKNGDIWIIETKGGEKANGEDNNVDKQIINKFNSFKKYAEQYNVRWGFVREKNEVLLINNTEYEVDLNHLNWHPLEDVL